MAKMCNIMDALTTCYYVFYTINDAISNSELYPDANHISMTMHHTLKEFEQAIEELNKYHNALRSSRLLDGSAETVERIDDEVDFSDDEDTDE